MLEEKKKNRFPPLHENNIIKEAKQPKIGGKKLRTITKGENCERTMR